MTAVVGGLFLVALTTALRVVGARLEDRANSLITDIPEAGLSGAECAERYGYPPQISACYRRGFAQADAGLVVDQRGFAHKGVQPPVPEYEVPAPQGTQRIACLGGSTTANMWPTYLEARLNESSESGTRFEVVNGAMNGYTASDLLIRYRHDVAQLRPDLLVIYSGWNDLTKCTVLSEEQLAIMESYAASGDRSVLVESDDPWVVRNAEWFEERRATGLRPPALIAGDAARQVDEIARQIPGLSDLDTIRRFVRRADFLVEDLSQDLSRPSIFDETAEGGIWAEAIRQVVEEAQAAGAVVAIVVPPHAFGCKPVPAYRCSEGLALAPSDRYRFMEESLPAILRRLAAATGALIIDARSPVHAREDRCSLFEAVEGDPSSGDELHLNDAGLRLVAEAVERAVRDAGVVPRDSAERP